jgi:NAD+ kinase
MSVLARIPKRIAVAFHTTTPDGTAKAEEVSRFLLDQGVEAAEWGSFQDEKLTNRIEAREFDLLIALGGDGTVLRAGSLGAPIDLPILGINFGHFGFLTEVKSNEWRAMLQQLLRGEFRLEERMLLRVELCRGDLSLGAWHVVNEVVVCRGQFVRPIQIETQVNGYLMNTYVADGLIAATPTGSTAYALAAGGPILPPELRNILIIPVAPHLSMDRAIILSQGSGVTMTVHTSHEAVMSVDGHPPIPMLDGDSVRVSANDYTIHFIRFQDPGYFYRNITAYMEQNPLTGMRK